jgi:hypothetical protein
MNNLKLSFFLAVFVIGILSFNTAIAQIPAGLDKEGYKTLYLDTTLTVEDRAVLRDSIMVNTNYSSVDDALFYDQLKDFYLTSDQDGLKFYSANLLGRWALDLELYEFFETKLDTLLSEHEYISYSASYNHFVNADRLYRLGNLISSEDRIAAFDTLKNLFLEPLKNLEMVVGVVDPNKYDLFYSSLRSYSFGLTPDDITQIEYVTELKDLESNKNYPHGKILSVYDDIFARLDTMTNWIPAHEVGVVNNTSEATALLENVHMTTARDDVYMSGARVLGAEWFAANGNPVDLAYLEGKLFSETDPAVYKAIADAMVSIINTIEDESHLLLYYTSPNDDVAIAAINQLATYGGELALEFIDAELLVEEPGLVRDALVIAKASIELRIIPSLLGPESVLLGQMDRDYLDIMEQAAIAIVDDTSYTRDAGLKALDLLSPNSSNPAVTSGADITLEMYNEILLKVTHDSIRQAVAQKIVDRNNSTEANKLLYLNYDIEDTIRSKALNVFTSEQLYNDLFLAVEDSASLNQIAAMIILNADSQDMNANMILDTRVNVDLRMEAIDIFSSYEDYLYLYENLPTVDGDFDTVREYLASLILETVKLDPQAYSNTILNIVDDLFLQQDTRNSFAALLEVSSATKILSNSYQPCAQKLILTKDYNTIYLSNLINNEVKSGQIKIYNLNGIECASYSLNEGIIKESILNLSKGIYLYQFTAK